MIRDGRKSMRHALWDNDNVARLYFPALVTNHCAAAGRAIQDGGHFAVRRRTPPVDDGAPSDQGGATRYDDVTLCRIVMENSSGSCCVGTLLAACRRGFPRSRATATAGVRVHPTAAPHRPTVDDCDTKLIT